MKCTVIIPAAGSGTRFGGETPKQFFTLRGRPLIAHAVERFLGETVVDRVIICGAPEHLSTLERFSAGRAWDRVAIIEGGDTRRDSVAAGVRAAGQTSVELVAVHDAVRPFFGASTFRAVLEAAAASGAALPALRITETIHRVEEGFVAETPDRNHYYSAQTPQCFRIELLREVLDRAIEEGYPATDEAGAVARYGHRVKIVTGDLTNIKITHPEDLQAAELNFDRWAMQI
ncbi:MAG TPA: 2-C-methyl-D-erythritol 4-phosphate cytidylyltransferase [Thermoanaerobaculia bacterium]|nr:2-C-methyl-D-erythritol 4-phosphate cytidylyltransferase [Thermoanaerobaculia bacterium]